MLRVELTNASTHPFTVVETSTQRDFEIHVLDSKGHEPPLTENARSRRGMGKAPEVLFRNFPLTVQPGDVLKAREDIRDSYTLLDPGKYTVTVCRVVMELGPVLSNPVILTLHAR